jgi:hypothetical protein
MLCPRRSSSWTFWSWLNKKEEDISKNRRVQFFTSEKKTYNLRKLKRVDYTEKVESDDE